MITEIKVFEIIIIYKSFSLWPFSASACAAFASISVVDLMLMIVFHFWFVLSWEFAFGDNEARVVVGPLLNWLLLLAVVGWSIGCRLGMVEIIAIGVHIVPCRQICSWPLLSFVMCFVGRVGTKLQSHWMLIPSCYWHHFLKISMVRKFIHIGCHRIHRSLQFKSLWPSRIFSSLSLGSIMKLIWGRISANLWRRNEQRHFLILCLNFKVKFGLFRWVVINVSG